MHFNRTLPPILLQSIQLDQANNDGDAEGAVCDDADDNDGLSDVEEESFDGTPGYNPGTDTDPFNADTDGYGISDFDELNYDGDPAYTLETDINPLSDHTDNDGNLDSLYPVPLNYNYEDGDIAPWGSPDSTVNAGDLLVCLQLVPGMKDPTNEELAHADLYPAGAPDGKIGLSDFIQLQQLVFFQTGATETIPAIAPVYRVYTDATLPDPAEWPATAIIITGE